MSARFDILDSPLGTLTPVVDGEGALTHLLFAGQAPPAGAVREPGACAAAAAQLRAYFAGERRAFDLPLAPRGTPFQRSVWAALREVGWGETVDYASLAARLGRPGAARAVGRANATNPIPVVIPCHRVVGRDGSLTGYAGGLDAKRVLLALEGGAGRGKGRSDAEPQRRTREPRRTPGGRNDADFGA
jgi:methylated-DNA-[protein]-cysteine S-methyltransferase